MPEGHSIHRVAGALTSIFAREQVQARSPQGRFIAGAQILDGQQAGVAQAWGKHLFLPFRPTSQPGGEGDTDLAKLQAGADTGYPNWLHVHLGLYGSWRFDTDQSHPLPHAIGAPRVRIGEGDERVEDAGSTETWLLPQPRGQVRLRLHTEHAVADLSGPNRCEILDPVQVADTLDKLGPDPIRDHSGDEDRFVTLMRRRSIPIGQAVMDQSICAGPGNIYRAECLFRTRINPNRAAKQVSENRLRTLWRDLVVALREGVRDGKIITVPTELVPAHIAPEDKEARRFAVYHRTGRSCLRCGATVREKNLAGRKLFWCPGCQN
ncbi:Fpg/Nei family DNA glycosylase [Boudabousia marimammalium]|uniref:DNA-(apurinic or apyrimidinic site) lyase n=1 Tax=Boudabousia marimammalium TaxID=156892 RepID=A0A1Q5PLY8_9ACTO|nr:zinc finger domain-containing protein [Boudabousia marimammalium]OKL48059.1 hypothetical protein BM477_06215 [Boudabousia marimammalium]